MAETNGQKIEELINFVTNLINQKFIELSSVINEMQDSFSASIGQNLMQFSDLLGGKLDDAINMIEELKKQVDDLKKEKEFEMEQAAELSELIKQSVIEDEPALPSDKAPPIESKPSPPIVPKTTPTVEKTLPIVAKPTVAVQKPPIVKPTVAPPEISETVPKEVIQLLDGIANAVVSKVPTSELATIMDNTRNEIIKVFRWHPVLYELASFSRRIQKLSTKELSADISSLLIEKIQDWKTRISSE
ncbi:MAG: hypothetical protein ACTSRG_05070 [Candidatus Helarchaeota archaeon]